ncbi:hypothetical protein D3C87_616070 [compost metagenome]
MSFCFFLVTRKSKEFQIVKKQERLQNQILKKKIISNYEYQYLNDDKSSNREFSSILKDKNIKVIYKTKYPISDVIIPEEKIEESKKCYQIMMNYQLEAKFGNLFFDSARIESKKTHLQNLNIK